MTSDNVHHTILAIVQDRPGVLNRVVSEWQRFNIKSLTVGTAEKPGVSRMTFVVDASTDAGQVVDELGRLEEVVEIRDISDARFVARELALVKVRADKTTRSQILEIAGIFRADVVDVSDTSILLELTGQESKIDSMVRLLQDYKVLELVRTGRVAMACDPSAGD